MNIPNVGPYFTDRFKKVAHINNNTQLINKFKIMDEIEIKMYLELIFLNKRRKECIDEKYEIRNINRYGYNSTLDLLHKKNIGKNIRKMKSRTKTLCNKA